MTIADVMTAPPVVLSGDTPFSESSHLLQTKNLSGSLVVDNDGVFIGVIFSNDSRHDGVSPRQQPQTASIPLFRPTEDSTSHSTS